MTASRADTRPANPEPQSPITVYEVDEFDTIRLLGAKEPEVYADVYPGIDPALLYTADAAVQAAESAVPLALRFEALLWDEIKRQQARVNESEPRSARGRARRRHLDRLLRPRGRRLAGMGPRPGQRRDRALAADDR